MPLRPDTLWHAWSFDPVVLVPLLLAVWLYGRGLRQLWTSAGWGRGVALSHVVAFAFGTAALFVALVSPLDVLGEELLSAHMAQHALLVTAAPVLLLLGKPGAVLAWALPAESRKRFLRSHPWRALAALIGALSRPLPSAFLHGLALWGWHAPRAFDAAVASYGVHMLEHACFFGTALLFWKAILDAHSRRRAAAALGAAFATLVHGGLLGALLTTAPFPLYAWYLDRTAPWGLNALEDQQLAGLIMWVPMGIVYLGACLALASRLLASRNDKHLTVDGAPQGHWTAVDQRARS
ncbi:cytochrome c oxidase assembly protein [Ramlibacter tataouinensis]|uniref:cytochrome c oxidase assembly protein n=1 Tax=Ramlibacter tataouinensis TaxID=94132 RepID=UPI001D04A6FC|nr:cytochrome c oxidase assembly protein [Ramlibacter tataouinensis]